MFQIDPPSRDDRRRAEINITTEWEDNWWFNYSTHIIYEGPSPDENTLVEKLFEPFLEYLNTELANTTALFLFLEEPNFLWVQELLCADPLRLFKIVTREGKYLRSKGAIALEEEPDDE